MTRFAILPLRLIVGIGFIAHGYAKLSRGPAHFATILDAMGIPHPGVMAWATTLVELAGGAAVLLGFAVAAVAIPLTIVMLTAVIGVHWAYGFSTIKLQAIGPNGAEFGKPGYELAVVYIAALVGLALLPSTPWSLDRWWSRRSAHSISDV